MSDDHTVAPATPLAELPVVPQALRVLWAKTADAGAWHPLLCHLLDVGFVALTLLESPEARHQVRLFTRLLDIPAEHVPVVVAYLAALHDLGKASPGFQRKSEPLWREVENLGFQPNPLPPSGNFLHGAETFGALLGMLAELGVLGLPTGRRGFRATEAIAQALGAHHGVFFKNELSKGYPEIPPLGSGHDSDDDEPWRPLWREARMALANVLRDVFLGEKQGLLPLPANPANLSSLCLVLDGLTILADWLGSEIGKRHPYAGPLEAYPPLARARARQVVAERRLSAFVSFAEEPTFATLFPDRAKTPRPLQTALDAANWPDLPARALVIIEAPTGEGKTEAALLLASRLAYRGDCRGFYFALPTVATSNQMHDRVSRFLTDLGRSGAGQAALTLVNGQAEFDDVFAAALERARQSHAGSDTWAGEDDELVVADTWFLPHKQSLLSPYGVGTVDQAMYGALNVRHVALRLLGLAGKVVIVDEVHAYDLYMSKILYRLLSWLRELGASVILLSATLPRQRREELIEAYSGQSTGLPEASQAPDPYPLVTLLDGTLPGTPDGTEATHRLRRIAPKADQPDRVILIERRPGGETTRATNARWLLDEVATGGQACWLVNTVREAQACYQTLDEAARAIDPGQRPDLILFHARFLLERRRQIEQEVVGRLGPTGQRERPLIVVATQVVEQSLDLDFDLLVTQIAPVDLILQRAGRLHRHHDHDKARPANLKRPRLVILDPERDAAGQPDFGGSAYVYELYILLRSLVALRGRQEISVPRDVRQLIEDVYADGEPSAEALAAAEVSPRLLAEALRNLRKTQAHQEGEAKKCLLGRPDAKTLFTVVDALPLDDEDVERDEFVAAQTRLAEPSVRVVLLDLGDPLVAVLRAGGKKPPALSTEQTLRAFQRSVGLADRDLVKHLKSAAASGSPDVVSLDGRRGLNGYLLVCLSQNCYSWQTASHHFELRLDEKIGVTIRKEKIGK